MKIRSLVCANALLSVLLSVGCASNNPEKIEPPNEQEFMEKWMAFATPTDRHAVLADKVGRWSVEVTFWMPGAPEPTTSTGASDMRLTMDGRYLEDRFSGDFGGMPFSGQGLTGYDNMTHEYVGTWIDNMGTGIMVTRGTYDTATKTFEFHSAGPDVARGHYVPMRMVEKWSDKNHFVVEMFGPDFDGKEYMSMRMVYVRQS